jgi:hypothetical protein
VGIPVAFDDATDCHGDSCQLIIGEVGPLETPWRSALPARMCVERFPRMDEHNDRGAGRFNQLRSPSLPGIRKRAAEIHDNPVGRGAT